ncbi:hypothetical protein MLD38_013945 [Melastoma candidum]|uniref:Uncharacterized protein n=1 Tax=Melastoma candidum TaxID=119954 RepID=A0ACB9RB60_9MYRT|nr:hypothetical protein MLD38_013945 [Melastoma candidum]
MASPRVVSLLFVVALVSYSATAAVAQICQQIPDAICGRQIVDNIFHNIGNLTETCCDALLRLGEECHNTLVERRIAAGGYEKDVVNVIERSFGAWKGCSSLDSCRKLTDATCGSQIVQNVFHNKGNVTEDCCGVLLKKGKRCHTVLVGERIIAGGFEKNATKVIRASAALWDKCSIPGA